jgi:hypothetical protein
MQHFSESVDLDAVTVVSLFICQADGSVSPGVRAFLKNAKVLLGEAWLKYANEPGEIDPVDNGALQVVNDSTSNQRKRSFTVTHDHAVEEGDGDQSNELQTSRRANDMTLLLRNSGSEAFVRRETTLTGTKMKKKLSNLRVETNLRKPSQVPAFRRMPSGARPSQIRRMSSSKTPAFQRMASGKTPARKNTNIKARFGGSVRIPNASSKISPIEACAEEAKTAQTLKKGVSFNADTQKPRKRRVSALKRGFKKSIKNVIIINRTTSRIKEPSNSDLTSVQPNEDGKEGNEGNPAKDSDAIVTTPEGDSESTLDLDLEGNLDTDKVTTPPPHTHSSFH